jgi:hypothetical protein
MPVNKRIAVGTEVSWVSQASGSYVKKTGVIQAFVPALKDVRDIWKTLYPDEEFKYGNISQPTSSIPRYLVKVRLEKKKVYTYYAHYCPSASVVEKQNPEALRDETNL